MTLSISDLLVVDFDDGYDGMRAATFDDLASLEGAEKVWHCSVDGLNYSVKVCDHEGITPPCGWWIRIPAKEEE